MISEETLRAATKEYAKDFYTSLPETAECDHAFSPKFEKKMRHLCHKAKYKPAYTFLKRIACAMVAFILCASAFLALNTEVRASIIGWVTEKYNSYIRYSFSGKDNASNFSSYDFADIPEGYVLLERTETSSGTTILYINDDGRIIDLSYEYNVKSNAFFFKVEDHIHTNETVDGITMDIYISNNPKYNNTIIWSVDDDVLFILSANFDKDDLIKLAKNVSLIK